MPVHNRHMSYVHLSSADEGLFYKALYINIQDMPSATISLPVYLGRVVNPYNSCNNLTLRKSHNTVPITSYMYL